MFGRIFRCPFFFVLTFFCEKRVFFNCFTGFFFMYLYKIDEKDLMENESK